MSNISEFDKKFFIHRKNDFIEISKNLAIYTDLKIIILDQKIIIKYLKHDE